MRRQVSKMASLVFAAAFVAALAAALGEGSPRAAADPSVADVEVAVEGSEMRVSFALVGAFDEAFRARLESGLPTELTYEVELLRDRRRWLDRRIKEARLQVVAMYNALTREYLVNVKLDGRLTESRVVRDLATLEAAMTRVDGMAFFAVEEGDAGQRMRVRVQAELGTRTVFFFVPTTRTTDWAYSEKLRLPAAPPG